MGPTLSVSIFELSQGRAPDDAHAALKQFVDNESRADYKVRSIAPIAFGGYPSLEVESQFGGAGSEKPGSDLRNWLRACALIWPFVIELFP
jgi:hypothetical protein